MAKLTTSKRNALPSKAFALPGRRYPLPDKSHAANAKARVSEFGTQVEKAAVNRAVARKFPGMGSQHPHRNLGHYLHPKGGK